MAETNFGRAIQSFLNDLPDEVYHNWRPLIDQLLNAKNSTPNKKWLRKTEEALNQLDQEEVVAIFMQWLDLILAELRFIIKDADPYFSFLSEKGINFLRGMAWASGIINDDQLNVQIEELGIIAYKKITGHGAVAAKIGNACLFCFSILPFNIGVAKLVKYRVKIKYATAKKLVEKYISKVAQENGVSPRELEEISVDEMGLTEDKSIARKIGQLTGSIEIDNNGSTSIHWYRKDGFEMKSTPSVIKVNYKTQFKALKQEAKNIAEAISIQKIRVEQIFLQQREWLFPYWKQYYIDHQIVNTIAKRLIWNFKKGRKKATGIFYNGQFINLKRQAIDWLDEKTKVTLWHPINYKASAILRWRNLLQELMIQQPFKQAYREVYLLTDAEVNTETYSNRFAAHVLKQHQFASLCKVRGWKYKTRGAWLTEDVPTLTIPSWDMSAEFWIEINWDSEQTASGVFNYVFSDQVRFYREGDQLNLEDVPPLVFSEVMRDVDLFVGVCSIGNDPTWQDNHTNEYNEYWEGYAFGELTESAKTRLEVLKNLIPRLKIAKHCSFDGKFLVVKGDIRSYKIHAGSGNILMTPNDQYLCIVPNAKMKKDTLYLPFEGDRMLSIILSKAFMLAEDKKIKDATILSQIR